MKLHKILEIPSVYNLKTRAFSLGRANVWRYLASLPPLPRHARVLDVGCGTGRHADIFANLFVGADINVAYVKHARKNHPASFSAMDASSLAFVDETFDLVYAVGLFHHLDDALAQLAALEMQRVLRPGGTALIIDALLPKLGNPIGYALARLDRGEFSRRFQDLVRLLDPYNFSPRIRKLPGGYPYERAVFVYTK